MTLDLSAHAENQLHFLIQKYIDRPENTRDPNFLGDHTALLNATVTMLIGIFPEYSSQLRLIDVFTQDPVSILKGFATLNTILNIILNGGLPDEEEDEEEDGMILLRSEALKQTINLDDELLLQNRGTHFESQIDFMQTMYDQLSFEEDDAAFWDDIVVWVALVQDFWKQLYPELGEETAPFPGYQSVLQSLQKLELFFETLQPSKPTEEEKETNQDLPPPIGESPESGEWVLGGRGFTDRHSFTSFNGVTDIWYTIISHGTYVWERTEEPTPIVEPSQEVLTTIPAIVPEGETGGQWILMEPGLFTDQTSTLDPDGNTRTDTHITHYGGYLWEPGEGFSNEFIQSLEIQGVVVTEKEQTATPLPPPDQTYIPYTGSWGVITQPRYSDEIAQEGTGDSGWVQAGVWINPYTGYTRSLPL
jgi:hypothetical protein